MENGMDKVLYLDGYITDLKSFIDRKLPKSREASLALTKLEEFQMWAEKALETSQDYDPVADWCKHQIDCSNLTSTNYDRIEVMFVSDLNESDTYTKSDDRELVIFITWATPNEWVELRFSDCVVYRKIVRYFYAKTADFSAGHKHIIYDQNWTTNDEPEVAKDE
jgi:hypothetical protein